MIVARAWETDGTGSFIGEPLAGDLLRAVAYKRIGWHFEQKKKGDHLSGALIERLGKRKILNTDELLLAKSLKDELEIQSIVEKELSSDKEEF